MGGEELHGNHCASHQWLVSPSAGAAKATTCGERVASGTLCMAESEFSTATTNPELRKISSTRAAIACRPALCLQGCRCTHICIPSEPILEAFRIAPGTL